MATGWQPLSGLLLAIFINTAMCYRKAQPIEGIGIAMPGLLPPLIAAMSALLLVPDQAPPFAFVAGVLAPLIGADLLHLRDMSKLSTGIASTGGVGTFDGIVLSGIVAAYLASAAARSPVHVHMYSGGASLIRYGPDFHNRPR